MILDFSGQPTTPRRRAKELALEMLVALSLDWWECEEDEIPLSEGMTERERRLVDDQLRRIAEQFARYHKLSPPHTTRAAEETTWTCPGPQDLLTARAERNA